MKFELKMRELKESDLRAECPFLPEPENYEIYLNALVEDIDQLEAVNIASRVGSTITIEVNKSIYPEELRLAIKPFISSSDRYCQYRLVSFGKVG